MPPALRVPHRNIVNRFGEDHYKKRNYYSQWKTGGPVFDRNVQTFLARLARQVSNVLSSDDIQLATKMYQMGVPDGMIYSIIRFMRNDTHTLRIEERGRRDPRH